MRIEPNRNVYVGHRYVPKIFGEWDKKFEYEGLSIVTHQGNSYTSKKRVPVGIDIFNEDFWVVTGNYNAQIEYYREETMKVKKGLDDLKDSLTNQMNNIQINVADFNITPDKDMSSPLNELLQGLPEHSVIKFPKGDYIFSLILDKAYHLIFEPGTTITPVNNYAIHVMGSKELSYKLEKKVNRGDTSLQLLKNHSLKKEDFIYLRDDAFRPFDNQEEINGEVHQVKEACESSIELYDTISHKKEVSNRYNIEKINMIEGLYISDVIIRADKSIQDVGGIRLENVANSYVGNITVIGVDLTSLMLKECYHVKVDGLNCKESSITNKGGYGYGLLTTNSRHINVDTLTGSKMRHTFDNSGSYHVSVNTIKTFHDEGVSVFLAHNSYGGDLLFNYVEINYPLYDGVMAYNQGVQTVNEDYPIHNVTMNHLVINSKKETALMGLFSQLPLINCHFGNVTINGGGNTRGIRLLCHDNKVHFDNVTMNNCYYGVFLDKSPSKNKIIKEDTFIVFNDINMNNVTAPFMLDNGVDSLKVNGSFNEGNELFYIRSTFPEVPSHYLDLKMRINNFDQLVQSTTASIKSIYRNNGNGTIKIDNTNDLILDLTDIHGVMVNDLFFYLRNDLLKVKTETVEHNIIKGFERGLIGQKYTIMNVGENRISISGKHDTFESKDGENKLLYTGDLMTIIFNGSKWYEV